MEKRPDMPEIRQESRKETEMKKRLMSLVVASAMALAMFGAMPMPQAQAAKSDCPSTYLCAWWDTSYNGARYQFAGNNWTWHWWAIADDDSSWYNHGTSGANVQVYRDVGYSSTTICVHYNTSYASNSFANDKGSSNKWSGC